LYSPLVKYLARPLAYLAPLIDISIMFMGMKVRIRADARILMNIVSSKPRAAENEPDPDLRYREQVPLLEESGIEAFLRREVLPDAAEAWYVSDDVNTGYKISFTRYCYKPKPMRTQEEIRDDIEALEKDTVALLEQVLVEMERPI
jgi:hypothetical protein